VSEETEKEEMSGRERSVLERERGERYLDGERMGT
jgi:hypothetical protein